MKNEFLFREIKSANFILYIERSSQENGNISFIKPGINFEITSKSVNRNE